MPNMDGFEATRAIRAWEKETGRKAAPIVALTAHVANSDVEWRRAGMNDYLTKPFTITTLARAMSNFLTATEPPPQVIARERKLAAAGPAAAASSTDAGSEVADESGAFDHSVLDALGDMQAGESDLVGRALKLFEEHSKEAVLTLARTLREGDAAAIKSAAHALKSMSVNVGARALAEPCSEIEALAMSGDVAADFGPLIKRVRKEFTRAHAALPDVAARYARSAA